MPNLDDTERATMLAALRFWQDNIGPDEHESLAGFGHFVDEDPLSFPEVDELCEKLNTPDPSVETQHKISLLSFTLIQLEAAEKALIEVDYPDVASMVAALIKAAKNEINKLYP